MKHLKLNHYCAAFALPLLFMSTSHAVTPVWFDGFDAGSNSLDINTAIGFPRQGGAGIPTSYLTNSANQATDYHQQVFTAGPLLLAGDGGIGTFDANPALNTIGLALATPNINFIGTTGGGEIIGRQITFSLDAFTNASAGSTGHAAITVASSGLAGSGTSAAGFSVRFVEDQFGAAPFGNFIQFWDGASLVNNLLVNPAGAGAMNVQLNIGDTDGNPWDGVGATTIGVMVNGNAIGSYTKLGGGYTNNYITMEGSANFANFGPAMTSTFDNLTVFSDVIPEPSAALLGGLGLIGLLRRRRA